MSPGSDDDNKIKSITMLVRALIGLVLIVFVLMGYILFTSGNQSDTIQNEPQPLVCGNASVQHSGSYSVKDGRYLFKANCSSCHWMTDRASTGPGLQGVLDRIPGGKWRYTFVRFEDSLIAQKDPYTLMLVEKWKPKYPHRFPNLSNEDIDAILGYR